MLEARGMDYSSNNYGYRPTAWVCGLFVALFAITTSTFALPDLSAIDAPSKSEFCYL